MIQQPCRGGVWFGSGYLALKDSHRFVQNTTRRVVLLAGHVESDLVIVVFSCLRPVSSSCRRDCGIFGAAPIGEEYLRMALENRRSWARKGQNIVRDDMVEGSSRKAVASQEDTIMFSWQHPGRETRGDNYRKNICEYV
jgi:hypothetical protein